MKHAKRFLALLLAVVMVMAMGTTAFAAENNGTITIQNAANGTSYSVYKIFDLTHSGDKVAYSFTKTGDNENLYNALVAEGSPFKLAKTSDETVFNVSTTAKAKDISDWFKQHEDVLPAAARTEIASSETLVFSGLELGYYYITSGLGTTATIDSTLPNVTVIDKNQKDPDWGNPDPDPDPDSGSNPNPGKMIKVSDGHGGFNYVSANAVNFGDEVTFSIAVNAKAFQEDKLITYYHIKDILGDGFENAKNFKVMVGDKELKQEEKTGYTLNQDGNKFDITIPFGMQYGNEAKIVIEYTATVKNSAVIAGDGNLNTAKFTYTASEYDPDKNPGDDGYFDPKDPTHPLYPAKPNPDDVHYPDNDKVTTTYVFALGIAKVDPKGKSLSGAKFSVTGPDGKPVHATVTGEPGVYEYSATDNGVTEFETDNAGLLVIKGLKDGEYKIKETVAPDGYNLLEQPIPVKINISDKDSYKNIIRVYLDSEGNVVGQEEDDGSYRDLDAKTNVAQLVVVNKAGTELPSTGGMGTTLFYALGSTLLVGAAVLLITRRRMKYEA